MLEQGESSEDEQQAQHDGPEDAEEEDLVLVPRPDAQGGECQQEDKDVVDAERFLHQVGGDEFLGHGAALPPPHETREQEGEGDPESAPPQRLFDGEHLLPAVDHEEVKRQEDNYAHAECDPGDGAGHAGCPYPFRSLAVHSRRPQKTSGNNHRRSRHEGAPGESALPYSRTDERTARPCGLQGWGEPATPLHRFKISHASD
ncbi:MAG: hypothetical protein BWY79_00693 [Actinobacteria bacterium ADurb.Bin444]|nr:MAG: hypothetical protein BWY79_00693 [Actinobacteria bacterium ADurb.Bin444]